MCLLCNFLYSGYFWGIVLYIYDCKLNQTLNKLKDLFRVNRPKCMFSLIYVLVWVENGEEGRRRINIYMLFFSQTLSKIKKPTEKFRITQVWNIMGKIYKESAIGTSSLFHYIHGYSRHQCVKIRSTTCI